MGLLPDGHFETIAEDAPTLTYNAIGRHVSTMVCTKVASVHTPWMALCEVGDTHLIPVSHGEGRFVCNDKTLRRLAEKGQIITQYVDTDGNPSAYLPYNPQR